MNTRDSNTPQPPFDPVRAGEVHFDDPRTRSEWDAQERALREERLGVPVGDDARVAEYRLLARALRHPPLDAVPVDQHFQPRSDLRIRIKAKHYIVAAGAIGSPVLLLRSKVPNPSGRLGKNTYLHPTVISGALFDEHINGHSGAPQSIYSDQFVWPEASDKAGYDGKFHAQIGVFLKIPKHTAQRNANSTRLEGQQNQDEANSTGEENPMHIK